MAEHDAIVEVSTGGNTFKISGTEKFVEKMVELLPAAFPAERSNGVALSDDTQDKSKPLGGGAESLDDFVRRVHLTNDLTAVKKVGAFVVYLTEVASQSSCSVPEIESCFDKAGMKTPGNLNQVAINATKPENGGLIRPVKRGQYAATTNGRNLVKELTQG